MGNVNINYDNFISKLKQHSTIETLKKYILRQREIRADGKKIKRNSFLKGPISINLDITVACNFFCTHCVDNKILNSGDKFTIDELRNIVKVLSSNGLKSIILIGGGEPTLHSQFEFFVRYIKSLGLQLGIVTNGSNTLKLIKIVDCLTKKDWIRFSLDAGRDETFQIIHKPRKKINLVDICSSVKHIKRINDKISIGFSYIVFHDDCRIEGIKLTENIDEIPTAAELAIQNNFDYITFKPCLIKDSSTFNKEALLCNESTNHIKKIVKRIEQKLGQANKISNGRIKVNESINLRAMLGDDLSLFRNQPTNCHAQIFMQVITPCGIYCCPAYRGDPKAFVSSKDGYSSQQKFKDTINKKFELMFKFDANKECKNIVCFYNRLNWWIEDFIRSGNGVHSLEEVKDDNFFL